MPLDPQAVTFLNLLAQAGQPPINQMPVAQARMLTEALRDLGGPSIPVARAEDRVLKGPGGPLRIRVYTPEGTGPFPIVMYFHGGGWTLASVEVVDPTCRRLCAGTGAIVVSVDYRLAPEHKFPAAPEDCYAATDWVARHALELHGDAHRLAVRVPGRDVVSVLHRRAGDDGPDAAARAGDDRPLRHATPPFPRCRPGATSSG